MLALSSRPTAAGIEYDAFSSYLLDVCGGSPNTVSVYKSALRQWEAFCESHGVPPGSPTESDAHRYISDLRRHGRTAHTIKNHLVALTAYEQWAHRPALWGNIRRPKITRRKPKTFTVLQCRAMIEAAANIETNPVLGARNRAICSVLWATGARIDSVLGAVDSDVETDDLKHHWITFRRSKNDEGYMVPLNQPAFDALNQYHTLRASDPGDDLPLFTPLFDDRRPLNYETVREMMNRASAAAKLKGFGCHSFRHSLGQQLVEAGVDVRYVQDMLGHKAISSPSIYTQIRAPALFSTVSERHPMTYREPNAPKLKRVRVKGGYLVRGGGARSEDYEVYVEVFE